MSQLSRPCRWLSWQLLLILIAGHSSFLQAADPVDFDRQVRRILADHCFQCHGPDQDARAANLRLDVREAALAKRESGEPAIVPGKPDVSFLTRRILSTDPNEIMPPPDQKNPLTPEEIELLQRWISEGAPYSQHWAFIAPAAPAIPQNATAKNPVDALVTERLRSQGLSLSPRAPLDVLCRRIHLDLIGLPPSPKEIDEFLAAAKQDAATAINQLIDRLLDNEHYGEKWARHWLDVARYADSNGFEKDLPRDQWAWRDWVIRSLNADQPYDQFLLEQFAGDLLPQPTQDQIIATGYLRNGMFNEEGAIVPEQFRMEGMFDRLDCLGKTVLGLSVQCAQCHSHKFDPLSQEEYYGLFAFLNDVCETQSWVYTPEQLAKIAEIQAGVRAAEEKLKSQRPGWQQELAAWEQAQRAAAPAWEVLDTTEQEWVGGVNHPHELADHSVMVLGHRTGNGDLYVVAEPNRDGVTGLRFEALTHGDLPFGGPGRSNLGTFTLSELKAEIKRPGEDKWTELTLKNATSDFSELEQVFPGDEQKKEEEKKRLGPAAFLIDGKNTTGWRADRGPGRRNTDSVVVMQFAEPVNFPAGARLKIKLNNSHSPPGDGRVATQLGRMRFALTQSPDPAAAPYDHAATLALQIAPDARRPAEQSTIFAAWRKSVPELKEINDVIAGWEQQYPAASTSVLTAVTRDSRDPRETFLLYRGTWDKPRQKVAAHVPAVLHPLAENTTAPNRLDFARWLVDRRSPLTARVQVNRVWQAIFGRGLVETPEDFGTRAPLPEHLAVLDWLSVDFMEHGWSTKRLIRTIITSAVYQQTSQVSEEQLERDPLNVWLARGPRFRVEAEVLRDIALSAAGIINPAIGGPSIYPPVPESVLNDNYVRPEWKPAEGPDRYRRGLYVFRKRSMPDPVLTSLDAPNGDASCARRSRSNSPLASLISLNEPIFVEAARAMALRILREGGDSEGSRANYVYRLCTGRNATAAERTEILNLLATSRQRLADGWLSINEVATGNPAKKPEIPEHAKPQDAAAWTIVARVVLNLDETLNKN